MFYVPRRHRPQELWLVRLVASHLRQTRRRCWIDLKERIRQSNCLSTSIWLQHDPLSYTRHFSEVNRDDREFVNKRTRNTQHQHRDSPATSVRWCNCNWSHTHLHTTVIARAPCVGYVRSNGVASTQKHESAWRWMLFFTNICRNHPVSVSNVTVCFTKNHKRQTHGGAGSPEMTKVSMGSYSGDHECD